MHGIMQKKSSVYIVAGFLSLLLSFWLSIRETVINPDAICYLQSAADMKLGLQVGMHICDQAKWPFYSILIFGLHQIFGLSFEAVAYLLNAILTLISVITFIAIIRFISQNTRIVWFAAIVILLAHEFNSVRQYIIRDHGFWAFYLLSIYSLLKYFSNANWRNALLWNASIVLATLFRVEGAIFLMVMPFSVFLDRRYAWKEHFKSYLCLNTITFIILGILGISLLLHFHFDVTRLHEVKFQIFNGVETIIHHSIALKESLAQHVLTQDSARDAGIILFLMMMSWYLYSVVFNLSLIYTFLVIYAWFKKSLQSEKYVYIVLWTYVITNVFITASFLIENLFLSKRYLIALTLVLMMWVPFALNSLVERIHVKKWLVIPTIFLIFISALGGIFDFGYSKQYIHDGGNWLAQNSPVNATIYSNDLQLMYYSQHFGDKIFDKMKYYTDTKTNSINQFYDYLALRINHNGIENRINESDYRLVKVFSNKRGDQVKIYQRAQQ